MKTNSNFPTIKEMENAILFAVGDNNGKVAYQQESHTFLAVELIPYPCRDSGGSIDCIDFEEREYKISFQEAYHYWLAMEDYFNGIDTPTPAPIWPDNKYSEYEDLPF